MKTEKIIVGKNTKYPLKGILTLPENATHLMPAVVFVHGSGSSNMDEKVGNLTPFKDLAEGLARHGIASARYDKRSFAHGLKMIREKDITVKEETIEDAILATKILKQDSRIDGNKIFIVGHSMGAMLAPRIDAEGGNCAGLILMAGTPRKIEEVLEEQFESMLQSAKGLTEWILKKQRTKYMGMFEGIYRISDEEAKRKKYGGGVTMYYFKEMGEHAAPDYLVATRKPMLIMQGKKDFQVSWEKDFGAYKQLLGDRENITFCLYENLNHCFVDSVYGDIMKAMKEYKVEQHIGDNVIADMANWIKAV